jgi:hypothetical protein
MQSSTPFDKNIPSNELNEFPPTFSSSSSSRPPFSSSIQYSPLSKTNNTTMAANSPRNAQMTSAMGPPVHPAIKQLGIMSLMSPPDPVLDTFIHSHRQYDSAKPTFSRNDSERHSMPMSPPISPCNKPMSTTELPTTHSTPIKDPVLYPVDEITSSPTQTPLFAPAEDEDHNRIIDDHLRARLNTAFATIPPPKRTDYELMLSFKSQVVKRYEANPRGWLRQERAYLEADRKAHGKKFHSILPAKSVKTPRPRGDRVQKPQSAPRPIRTHPAASIGPMMRPAPRVSATPEPSRRVVTNREDKDFNSLPDYCPPLDSLPDKPNSLKVDWKGQPVDLSRDPHVGLLHPDEVALASNLRLDCATYLTSKRRIFDQRVVCLRKNKAFRKTDAQQACKIDVNKASKLWTAFDKVGWLDDKWVRQYL